MEMVMHNVRNGVTVAARYNKESHCVAFQLAFCKRSEDTFSRKRGYATATTRLDRSPRFLPLPSDVEPKEAAHTAFCAIRDSIREVPRRRTNDSVVQGIRDAIRGTFPAIPALIFEPDSSCEPCGAQL